MSLRPLRRVRAPRPPPRRWITMWDPRSMNRNPDTRRGVMYDNDTPPVYYGPIRRNAVVNWEEPPVAYRPRSLHDIDESPPTRMEKYNAARTIFRPTRPAFDDIAPDDDYTPTYVPVGRYARRYIDVDAPPKRRRIDPVLRSDYIGNVGYVRSGRGRYFKRRGRLYR